MKAASVCTVLGLTLISGALLAATTGVTGESQSRLEARFAALDSDGDGRIAALEAEASTGLTQHFEELDSNNDGVLTWRELQRHGMPGEGRPSGAS